MTDSRTTLVDDLAVYAGVPALTEAEVESVLALASVAAHGTGERTAAPLASFLAGMLAAARDDRLGAVDEMRRHVGEVTGGTG